MMRKKVTIRDVAAASRVSYQTVSRVLNNKPDVAEETRRRVRHVIVQLGYQPSAVARSLVSKRTRTLGLITADLSDYFFAQVISGAESEAKRAGYYLILGSTQQSVADEPEYLKLFTERKVDGILFARPSTENDSRHMLSLVHEDVPLVTTAYHFANGKVSVVDVDNVDGGEQAANCLIEAGHGQIGMITGPPTWKSAKDRAQGYRMALKKAGLAFSKAHVAHGDWSYGSGYRAMQQLLARDVHITAIFVHNDRMAIGAMSALREVGCKIPDDVAIVGYDDIPAAAYSYPPLTTMHQPMVEVGQVATELLIQIIDNPNVGRKEVLLKPDLVRRDTCH